MDGGDWPNGAADWGWGFTMIASTCPVRRLQLQGWASGSGGGLGTREKRREERTRKQQKGRGRGRGGTARSSPVSRQRPWPAVRRHARRECRGRLQAEERRGASLAYPRAGKTNIGMLLLLPFCCTYWRITGGVCANRLPSPATTGYALRTRQEETTGEAATSRPRPPASGSALALAASAMPALDAGVPYSAR